MFLPSHQFSGIMKNSAPGKNLAHAPKEQINFSPHQKYFYEIIWGKTGRRKRLSGGLARNRTGLQGFAVLCVTVPPRGLKNVRRSLS